MIKNLTGYIFGKLTVISEEPPISNRRRWLCHCECGKNIVVDMGDLTRKYGANKGCASCSNKKIWTPVFKDDLCYIPVKDNIFSFIDKEDYYKIKSYGWFLVGTGYIITEVNGKNIHLSHLITGAKNTEMVDHINRNILDNTKKNLRICTRSENMINRKIRKDNHTGIIGIQTRKDNKKYRVRIGVDKKRIELGSFDTIEEATKIRKKAENFYHKNFRYD